MEDGDAISLMLSVPLLLLLLSETGASDDPLHRALRPPVSPDEAVLHDVQQTEQPLYSVPTPPRNAAYARPLAAQHV